MLKFTAFLFGGVAYFTFLFTILHAIGSVSGLVVRHPIYLGFIIAFWATPTTGSCFCGTAKVQVIGTPEGMGEVMAEQETGFHSR